MSLATGARPIRTGRYSFHTRTRLRILALRWGLPAALRARCRNWARCSGWRRAMCLPPTSFSTRLPCSPSWPAASWPLCGWGPTPPPPPPPTFACPPSVTPPTPAPPPRGDFGLSAQGLALNLPAQDPAPRYTYSSIALLRAALFAPPWCAIAAGNPGGVNAALAPLLRRAMDQHRVGASLYTGRWTDVGTPERLALLNERH